MNTLKHYRWHTVMRIIAWCIGVGLSAFALFISFDSGVIVYTTGRTYEIVLAMGLTILCILLSVHALFFCLNRIIYAVGYQRKSGKPYALLSSLFKSAVYTIAFFFIVVFTADSLFDGLEDPVAVFDVTERYRCMKQDGKWMTGAMRSTSFCYVKYQDGGKQCTSNRQCQGACYLPLGSNGDLKYNEEGYILGICAQDTFATDCAFANSIPGPTKDPESLKGYCM